MKMNRRMQRILKKLKLPFPGPEFSSKDGFRRNAFMRFRGCVFLKQGFKLSRVSQKHFPDKTGYECFVNHVHLASDGTRRSAVSCLEYCTKLDVGLANFAPGKDSRSSRHFPPTAVSYAFTSYALTRLGFQMIWRDTSRKRSLVTSLENFGVPRRLPPIPRSPEPLLR